MPGSTSRRRPWSAPLRCSGQPATNPHPPQSSPGSGRGSATVPRSAGEPLVEPARSPRGAPPARRAARAPARSRGRPTPHAADAPRSRGESQERRPGPRPAPSGPPKGVRPPQSENCRSSGPSSVRTVRSTQPPTRTPRRGVGWSTSASSHTAGRPPNTCVYQSAAWARTACSSGSSPSHPRRPSKSPATGAEFSWISRSRARNGSRIRLRWTGSWEPAPSLWCAADAARAHRLGSLEHPGVDPGIRALRPLPRT